jgi:hypothetical protein
VPVADPLEQRPDLRVVRVVATNRDARTAAGGQLLGGVVDRAAAPERGRLAANAATGDVDSRTLLPENERDPLAAAPTRTRHERYPVLQAWLGHGSLRQKVSQVPDDERRMRQCSRMSPGRLIAVSAATRRCAAIADAMNRRP